MGIFTSEARRTCPCIPPRRGPGFPQCTRRPVKQLIAQGITIIVIIVTIVVIIAIVLIIITILVILIVLIIRIIKTQNFGSCRDEEPQQGVRDPGASCSEASIAFVTA